MRRGRQCAEKVCGEAQRRVAGTTVPPGRVFLFSNSVRTNSTGLDSTTTHDSDMEIQWHSEEKYTQKIHAENGYNSCI